MAVDCCLPPHVYEILPGAVSDSTMVGMGKMGIKYEVESQRQSFLEWGVQLICLSQPQVYFF